MISPILYLQFLNLTEIYWNKTGYKAYFIWPIPSSLLSRLIMAGSIQLFQSVKKYSQTLGIYPDSQLNLFNFRNLFAIFCFFVNCISALAFFLFKANTILEYGVAFYSVISQLYIFYILFVQMWQMSNILKLIARFEKFIEKSKYSQEHCTQNESRQEKCRTCWRIFLARNALVTVVMNDFEIIIFFSDFFFNRTGAYQDLWRVECENRENVWFNLFFSSRCYACRILFTRFAIHHGQLFCSWLEKGIIYFTYTRNVCTVHLFKLELVTHPFDEMIDKFMTFIKGYHTIGVHLLGTSLLYHSKHWPFFTQHFWTHRL